MAEDDSGPGDRTQDPRVARYRPNPAEAPTTYRMLQGFWGDSDRPGFRRLYFTRSLTTYAEFRVEDVASAADVPAEESPYPGEQATRVELRADAVVNFVRSRTLDSDPFDIDLRFRGARAARASGIEGSVDFPCPLCATVPDVTCDTSMTCETCFGDLTCPGGVTGDATQCGTCPSDDCATQQTCPEMQTC